jgi:hypothetical protein
VTGPDDDPIEARVRADVARHGWHVALFPPEGASPGWALTIGLFERFGHPELVVFGPDLDWLRRFVDALGARVRGGAQFAAGSEVEGVIEGRRVAFRPVARKWVAPLLGNAAWHYRDEGFPVLQVFWPDPGGSLPWEDGADPAWRGEQPLLHLSETQRALPEPLIEALRREGAL